MGIALFCGVYFSPAWAPAVDPKGEAFPLTVEGKAAVALFLLTVVWWVTEVIPIGITSITIGVVQALFLIRPARVAFSDFLVPSVWFIFASLIIGAVFTNTGLTKRIAYKMLGVVGERTGMILLGVFVLTSVLTLFMAHTAVAATIYPLLVTVHTLYSGNDKPTRFGRALFMGMAFVAGAGSIITLLGAARGAVAIGFYKDITGTTVNFFELAYYMAPVGIVMTFLLWGFFMIYCRPEKKTIPGLKDRVKVLAERLGPMSRAEIQVLVIVLAAIAVLGLRSFVPALQKIDKSAILLVTTILFFVLKILKIEDLEKTSWNIILLFGGAMSIGFCLWQTGAANWLAVHWLTMFEHAPALVFILGIAFFVMLMTNFIMNVAAIAISLPVALVIAPYLGVAPNVILFVSLVTAGMPFLLLVGAAPNAIAYASGQFTTKQFFMAGIPASILLMVITALFVWLIWPAMGMPVYL